MEIKPKINPKDYEVGVLIARFQIDEIHDGHKELIDYVTSNHKMVIIFLGCPVREWTKKNPLDFSMRSAMLRNHYPNAIILPLKDRRNNEDWSRILDEQIKIPFGPRKTVLYGSRDSFIPAYSGKYPTIELESSTDISATDIRKIIAKTPVDSPIFRQGVIFGIHAQRPRRDIATDIVVSDNEGRVLLARKPNETKYRFIGGYVDGEDDNYEICALRELREETGGNLIPDRNSIRYIASLRVDDWRYRGSEDKIFTTLFHVTLAQGNATPSDDIEEVKWIPLNKFTNEIYFSTTIIEEHQPLMLKLIEKAYKEGLVMNLGEREKVPTNVTFKEL